MSATVRSVRCAFLALGLFALSALSASAHAELTGSDPADGAILDRPPDRVRVYFSEPIEPEFFAVEVYRPDRARVDRRDARRPADTVAGLEASVTDLEAGTYTVLWRALSIDGHVVRGTFAFTVGSALSPASEGKLELDTSTAPAGASATVRWLTYLLGFVLLGSLAFTPLVMGPALRGISATSEPVIERAGRAGIWSAWIAVSGLLLLGLAALVLQAAEVTGVPVAEVFGGRAITLLLTATKYGSLWLLRTVLLIALLAVLVFLTANVGPRRRIQSIGASLAASFFIPLAASGHASAASRLPELAVFADCLHLIAGGFWIGGLVQLALIVPALRALPDGDAGLTPGEPSALARVARRFSNAALISVAVLMVSGLYASIIHVPSWDALVDTLYGALLSGKVLLFLPLLALGALNLVSLRRQRTRAPSKRRPRGATASWPDRFLRGIVLAEVVIAIGVLGVTAILAGVPPATTAAAEGRPFRGTTAAGGLQVTLDVRPNQAGVNDIEVGLDDSFGPVDDAERVALRMIHTEMEMGEREAVAAPLSGGRYRVQGGYLSMTGPWHIVVDVRRGGNPVQAQFSPTVGQAPGVNRPAFSPARVVSLLVTDPSRERGLPINVRTLAAIIFAGTGAYLVGRTARGRRLATGPLMGAAIVVFGTVLFGTSVADAYRRSLPNPVPADVTSLARGQEVYSQSCASCHGDSGRGDGPAGVLLRPRPADFRVHMAAGHTDQELFDWVTNGVDGTRMPPFAGQLSEQQRWDVINYIRSFATAR